MIDQNTIMILSGATGLLTLVVLIVALFKVVALGKQVVRLSEQIPGTGMTAKELAAELGGSIETSFQKFMPQPEKIAAAIAGSAEATLKNATSGVDALQKKFVENQEAIVKKFAEQEKGHAASLEKVADSIGGTVEKSLKSALTSVDSLHKKLLDGQDSVLDKWVAHEKTTTNGLAGISKALETATQQLTSGLTGGSQKMQSSLDDGSKKLAETLGVLATKLDTALKDHSDKTTKASAQLSAQLEKIATLEKEIDKLLHLQQTTEGTIKSVAASEEFKELVKALRSHLEASDKVLREVAKPRTIRLVEQDA